MNKYIKDNLIQPITVFSKDACPYCDKVKDLFDNSGICYAVVDVSEDIDLFKEVHSTVPQIYIGGICVGGSEVAQAVVDCSLGKATRTERGPLVHKVKSLRSNFEELFDGQRCFDIRIYDRDYREGDYLLLEEYDRIQRKLTGRKAIKRINHLSNNMPQLDKRCVIMNLQRVDNLAIGDGITYKNVEEFDNGYKPISGVQ